MTSRSTESASCADTTTLDTSPIYDLVCIGFGAAQLATAIAVQECQRSLKVLYLERKPEFSKRSDTHISRTRMESPFIYDLATLRNPRSAFSYANYLLARKRLIEFANSDRLNPLREEFDDYLRWCAEQFKDQVRYNMEVMTVEPETQDDTIHTWRIDVRRGNSAQAVRARNIIAPFPSNPSSSPAQTLPNVDFLSGQRIISMDDYNSRRHELRGTNEPRLNVTLVGSNSQLPEILDDLLSCPRLGNITVLTEDETLASLRILSEQEPPAPRLCSIWAKPSCLRKDSISESSELVQNIYMRAYEKQVASKGEFGLRVVMGKDVIGPCSGSNYIIRDTSASHVISSEVLRDLDRLVLGCRSKGDSLEEVQFKRGLVAGNCRVFLMSARSEGGRALAKDIAITAGKVVNACSLTAEGEGRLVQARM